MSTGCPYGGPHRADVENLFKIRFNMQGQKGNHSAYTQTGAVREVRGELVALDPRRMRAARVTEATIEILDLGA